MIEARRVLLAPVLELQDGVRCYLKVLGEDKGISSNMSRSSHRALLVEPATRIDEAWRVARIDLRGSAIATAFTTSFEERTDSFRHLDDSPAHAERWDAAIHSLNVELGELIRLIDDDSADAIRGLGYQSYELHSQGPMCQGSCRMTLVA